MKRSLDIILLFRFPTTNPIRLVSAMERCLGLVERVFEEPVPAHWAFAPRWLLSDSSERRTALLDRLKSRTTDMIVPLGYTGAYHPLLSLADLENEVKWAWSNPWHEGVADCLERKPEAMTSMAADVLRATAREIYSDSPFHLLLGADSRSVALFDGRISATPAWVAVSDLAPKALARTLKSAYAQEEVDHCLFVIDPTDREGSEVESSAIEAALEVICRLSARRRSMKLTSLRELEQSRPSGGEPVDDIFGPSSWIPTDPATRLARRRIGSGGAGGRRSGAEASRRRLERLGPIDALESATTTESEARPAKERTLIADMSGEVTLSEGPVDIHFRGGGFAGFSRKGVRLLDGGTSRSSFTVAGNEMAFQVVSAFSFEDEGCRGLRVIQNLSGESVVAPGRLLVDYYFHEGCEELLASAQVLYPQFAEVDHIDHYALLEIPLFQVGEVRPVTIEGEYPGGERYALTLTAAPSPLQLPGRSFLFRSGGAALRVGFPTLEAEEVELLPVRIVKGDQGSTLWINPRGGYSRVRASALSGIEERFSLTINADHPDHLAKAASARRLSGILEPDWIHRVG